MIRSPTVVLTVVLGWTAVGAAFAADVTFTVSPRETYVGAPVRIQVIIKRAREHQPPDFPKVEGAQVHESPENAEASRYLEHGEHFTVTYGYAVVPHRAGELTIPPIRVVADGESFSTSPMHIMVKESEADDLLYVRLVGKPESVYVGEPLHVTLEIRLKPFSTKNIRMNAEEMWRYAVDEHASTWGPFIENLPQGRARNITYRTATRADASDQEALYFVYSLNRKVWPERPGQFNADGVNIVVNYPLTARRNPATLLGQPYEVLDSRPISAVAEDSQITVKAPPAQGQPKSYRGALGEYMMTVAATPTAVTVGDPVVLELTIWGQGRLEVVQAPLLANQESLTADFRVSAEDLTGVVSGDAKEFHQIIRPKHDRVTEIPPIEFSYFNPRTEQYVILKGDPIPLTVTESTGLPVSHMLEGNAASRGRTQLNALESDLLANYNNIEELLSRQSLSFGWGTWAFAVSGPVLCAACLVIRRRHDRMTGDTGYKRRRSARKAAMTAIRRAIADENRSAAASHVAIALTGYVADRCNLPPGGTTRSDAVSQLRAGNVPQTLVNEIDGLLAQCEGAQFAAVEDAGTEDLAEQARDCVRKLERRKF